MKGITEEYKRRIEDSIGDSVISAIRVKDYVDHSDLNSGNHYVRTLQIPKVFDEKDMAVFESLVKTMYGICEKVIREYRANAAYRRSFPFSRELEELILLEDPYDSVLPMARFDVFYHEDTGEYMFCEINTDGTGAMNEDRILNQALRYNTVHQEMKEKYDFHSFELFDSWVKTALELYRTGKHTVEYPYIAICDFMYHTTMPELQEFRKRFEKAGYEAEVCEIRDLQYTDGKLFSPNGRRIDLVYRCAVTADIMQNYKYVQPFISAVKDGKTVVMGAFCTQIPHTKWFFKVLHDAATKKILTPEENAFVQKHVPYTNLLDSRFCSLDEIVRNKDEWILKPMDSYASQGVFAGVDFDPYTWDEIVDRYFNINYIYQAYHTPYRSVNCDFANDQAEMKMYTNLTGIYVYNGKLAGLYSRLSDGGIISSQYNEKSVATLLAGKKEI